MEAVAHWKYKKPKEYYKVIVSQYGFPDYIEADRVIWIDPFLNVKRVVLIDEEILHLEPKRHYDFVYSTADIQVSADLASTLAYVSGSIIIDQLKGQVTARCGNLIKNQITLGFV